jgi:hypothetical protein
MKLSTAILPGFLALSSFAYAQDKIIYKCAGPEGVGYRDTPKGHRRASSMSYKKSD